MVRTWLSLRSEGHAFTGNTTTAAVPEKYKQNFVVLSFPLALDFWYPSLTFFMSFSDTTPSISLSTCENQEILNSKLVVVLILFIYYQRLDNNLVRRAHGHVGYRGSVDFSQQQRECEEEYPLVNVIFYLLYEAENGPIP